MSEIKKLIERLCPDGVEYRKLVDLAEVGTGSSNKQDSSDDGKYPFFVRSKYIERHNDYKYDEEAIIIPGEGGIGDIFHYINGKYALHQRVYRIHFTTNSVNAKFAYYYLRNSFKKYILGKAVSATVTSIRKPMIQNFEIPVPPIEVQSKIVEILDNFTELEAELETELEARRKQYEYYRNQLLTFDKVGGARFEKLGELGFFYGGLSGKSKKDFEKGDAKFITYMNVYSNIAVDISSAEMVDVAEDEKQNSIQYGDVLFTGSSETPEECGMSSVVTDAISDPIYLNSFCFGFRIKDLSVFNVHFLKHLFRGGALRKQIVKTASGVTRFNVSKKKMESVEIPIPPLSEQQRIVSILDRFEALTTDLQSGLPAEIEARRKQYEYYREQLLTFKRKAA